MSSDASTTAAPAYFCDLSEAARRFHGMPPAWSARLIDRDGPEDWILLEGGEPIGTYPDGTLMYPDPEQRVRVWVRAPEAEEARRLWEQENGACSWCMGAKTCDLTGKECWSCEGSGLPYVP